MVHLPSSEGHPSSLLPLSNRASLPISCGAAETGGGRSERGGGPLLIPPSPPPPPPSYFRLPVSVRSLFFHSVFFFHTRWTNIGSCSLRSFLLPPLLHLLIQTFLSQKKVRGRERERERERESRSISLLTCSTGTLISKMNNGQVFFFHLHCI